MDLSQGKLRARTGPRIEGSTSIITSLPSRTLTGQILHIDIHQLYGFSFHLNWQFIKNGIAHETCMERQYVIYRDVRQCLEQIKRRPIEGMHSCIYGGEDNEAQLCFRATPIRSDYDSTASRALDRFYQLIHETDRCSCNVQ